MTCFRNYKCTTLMQVLIGNMFRLLKQFIISKGCANLKYFIGPLKEFFFFELK